jgi:threonine synthase
MFTDPHTGVALAVLEKLVRAGTIQAGQRTVVISTANGLKFAEFKVDYHEQRLAELGITSRHANQPVELAADFDAVRRAVFGKSEC